MVVAIVAVVVAAAGTGYAAIKLPRNSVGAKQLKKNAVTSPKVKNRSLRRVDFRLGQVPVGPTGPPGDPGPPGPLVDTLPSGRTLRGSYAFGQDAAASGAFMMGSISFPFPLAAAPIPHTIGVGAAGTADCPGSFAAPAAAPGHACVYEGYRLNIGGVPEPFVTCNLMGGSCGTATGADRHGLGVQFNSAAAGSYLVTGTWAVTAP